MAFHMTRMNAAYNSGARQKHRGCHECSFEDSDVCGILDLHIPCLPLTKLCKNCLRSPKPCVAPFRDNYLHESLIEEEETIE